MIGVANWPTNIASAFLPALNRPSDRASAPSAPKTKPSDGRFAVSCSIERAMAPSRWSWASFKREARLVSVAMSPSLSVLPSFLVAVGAFTDLVAVERARLALADLLRVRARVLGPPGLGVVGPALERVGLVVGLARVVGGLLLAAVVVHRSLPPRSGPGRSMSPCSKVRSLAPTGPMSRPSQGSKRKASPAHGGKAVHNVMEDNELWIMKRPGCGSAAGPDHGNVEETSPAHALSDLL